MQYHSARFQKSIPQDSDIKKHIELIDKISKEASKLTPEHKLSVNLDTYYGD